MPDMALLSPASKVYNMYSLAGVLDPIHRDLEVFRFLALPAELRVMVYSFVFATGYSAVDNCVASHISSLTTTTTNGVQREPLFPRKSKRSLLLVCRQIYREAKPILAQHPLTLHHGLLNIPLSDLISEDTFRNINSIILKDDGHNILDRRLPLSFIGHQRMATELAGWLEDCGHTVQKLELHFTSPQLKWHLDHCRGRNNGCDMRRWLTGVFDAWKRVRGIRHVCIFGWLPDDMKKDLLRLMQSDHSPFACLPDEVVRRIGAYVADLNDVSRVINRANHRRNIGVAFHPVKTTPSIFLVNRQLTEQLIVNSATREFELNLIYPPKSAAWPESITKFLGQDTLRTLTSLTIHLRHRAWLPLLFDIAHILGNGHRLVSFHLHLDDDHRLPATPTPSGLLRCYPDWALERSLYRLMLISNVGEVTFGGDLADPIARWFTEGLRRRMEGWTPASLCPGRGNRRRNAVV
ncbi:hypothetical protein K461DRAFT_263624 [Myriangium duriaei CBS 260.36]|uniref:F-box domain-containing protein n=1 Tax=Myriangium duriaei CBS 260.36 TaxID=1168546 RepID=A0A9P4JAT5_9PEZI|nr:hypothetical protein K461DRAFT_263624 [Myriangium duriaei CBS 260.36]